jgi:predicted AAA+ superfamily ATPase
MFRRVVKLPKTKSFFLFGARGTGKSTLLRELFSDRTSYRLDLLLPTVEERLSRDPQSLIGELSALPKSVNTVILDEIQKVPKLLDVVHYMLENEARPWRFIMTGSSGRKLKKDGTNLLAGRAFVRGLFPFVVDELGDSFNIDDALAWGTLPYIFSTNDPEEKSDYLASYVRTYLSEEIQREQVVRKLAPFRRFVEVAAQHNGKIINHSNIAHGIGVDPKTIATYYSILEDTLLGHYLLPFSRSFRKRLVKSPKFYFFDTGVARSAARLLSVALAPGTSIYGEVFEQLIVTQCIHKLKYLDPDARVSFYKDENDIEADLVIEKPGDSLRFVEIKSTHQITESAIKNLKIIRRDFPDARLEVWSQDQVKREVDGITMLHWQDGLHSLSSRD